MELLNKKFNMNLMSRFEATEISYIQKIELQVGSGSEEINDQEIIYYFLVLSKPKSRHRYHNAQQWVRQLYHYLLKEIGYTEE